MAIERAFREDYIGEFLIHSRVLTDGIYEENREWIPNTVNLDIASDSAVVFGNGLSRQHFKLEWIKRHRGGHLNKHKLHSYGCNAMFRDYEPDFLVVTGEGMAQEIVDSAYMDKHIVYAQSRFLSKYPGKFHLMPYGIKANSGSMATYLSAFDGFKKVYLVGFDTHDTEGLNNNMYAGTDNYDDKKVEIHDDKWSNQMYHIFRQFHDVQFYRVMPGKNPVTPIAWKGCLNYENITYKRFISYADL
jgi:hypothetical protein